MELGAVIVSIIGLILVIIYLCTETSEEKDCDIDTFKKEIKLLLKDEKNNDRFEILLKDYETSNKEIERRCARDCEKIQGCQIYLSGLNISTMK